MAQFWMSSFGRQQDSEATGVTVPLPEKQSAIAGALMNAVLLHKGQTRQLSLPLMHDLSGDAETLGYGLAQCR